MCEARHLSAAALVDGGMQELEAGLRAAYASRPSREPPATSEAPAATATPAATARPRCHRQAPAACQAEGPCGRPLLAAVCQAGCCVLRTLLTLPLLCPALAPWVLLS